MKIYRQHRPLAFVLFFLCLLLITAVGCGDSAEPTPSATLDPITSLGQTVFTDHCAICHANVPDTVLRGPSLHGIAQIGAQRVAGQDASAYIYSSIMRPSDYIVEGYDDLMPKSLAKDLTGEELDAVVVYLLTLQ